MTPRERTTAALRSLARTRPVELPVRGDCMRPLLESGGSVLIGGGRFYLPGDVVAFRRADGRLLVHRVLGYTLGRRGAALLAGGDHLSREDEPVRLDQVIGRMVDENGSPLRVPLRRRWSSVSRFLRATLRRSIDTWASATTS